MFATINRVYLLCIGEATTLSTVSSPDSTTNSLKDEASSIGAEEAPASSPEGDELSILDELPTANFVKHVTADNQLDRRPTAFVIDLGGADLPTCETRRLPIDPLSRYLPRRVERNSAQRRADIIRKRLSHHRLVSVHDKRRRLKKCITA